MTDSGLLCETTIPFLEGKKYFVDGDDRFVLIKADGCFRFEQSQFVVLKSGDAFTTDHLNDQITICRKARQSFIDRHRLHADLYLLDIDLMTTDVSLVNQIIGLEDRIVMPVETFEIFVDF